MEKIKNKQYIFLVVVLLIIFTGLAIFSLGRNKNSENQEFENIPSQTPTQKVVLAIDRGEGGKEEFSVEFQEGMTAFDLLKKKTEELGISLETKTFDIGILIEAIGDKTNGENQKYWLYYVNGEMPPLSADKKELKIGDKVEFKFEKSPF